MSIGVLAKKIDASTMVATDGHCIGLEQVSRHARAVADVVADVVRDRGGIARIIFRNAGFDLADQIATDVSTLGEDAAAKTGKDRDQRGTEAERDDGIDRPCGRWPPCAACR